MQGLGYTQFLPTFPCALGVWLSWGWFVWEWFLHQASAWTLILLGNKVGRASTSIPHDVDFRWDPIPSRPRGPNLHQGMADVFRNGNVYPVPAGDVERGSRV